MKRLVYSPQVNAWVKTDTGIVDLSPYITDFMVNRKVDEVSTASLTFRNPKEIGPDGEPRFMFTQHPVENTDGTVSYQPMFHPMDPITIVLTRLRGYPVQVFTGYCDTTPYVQLFPGTAKISASCTLKRILYTYWDPGLSFVNQYLVSLGWQADASGNLMINPTAEGKNVLPPESGEIKGGTPVITDSSFGYLIYRILQDVGNWDHGDIYVQGIPDESIEKIVNGIYGEMTGEAKASYTEYREFLKKVIGGTTVGGAVGSSGGGGTSGNGNAGNPSGQAASVGYPLGQKGSWGGGPGEGTHTWGGRFNNWQSCNAVDIMVAKGTSVFAVDDGEITNCGGSYGDENEGTNGLTWHLKTKDNEWFYQHNYGRIVHNGQQVKKGDPLGVSGVGGGSAHLHIACKNGDPSKLIKGIPGNPNER